jgi:hypothetical protein
MPAPDLLEQVDGIEERVHFDADGELVALQRLEDVEPYLEAAKRQRNDGLADRKSEFRRVGSYPFTVWQIFARKNGVTVERLLKDRDLIMRMVNDRDLAGFRTLEGSF